MTLLFITLTTLTRAITLTTLTRATWGHTFVPRGRILHWCLRTFHGVIHELLTLVGLTVIDALDGVRFWVV